MADATPAVTCSATGSDTSVLFDGRLTTRLTLPKGAGSAWVRYDFPRPFACRGLVSWTALPKGSMAELEASDDGQSFRSVGRVMQWASPTLVADNGLPLYSWTRTTTAKCFRVSVTGLTDRLVAGELQLVGETWLGSWPRSWTMNTFPLSQDARPDGISATNVVDLTAHLKPDGTLDWTFPAGNWVILRFGHTPTGHMNNRPPPAAEGLECDKLNREAVRAFLDGAFAPLERRFGSLGEAGLRHLLMDSWECKSQSWTPAMIEEFRRRRGYDPRPCRLRSVRQQAEAGRRETPALNSMKAPMKHFFLTILLLAPLAALHATRNLPGVPKFGKLHVVLFQALENHATHTSNRWN
jgi:hypothetical protein